MCPSIINFQFDSTFMYILLAMPLVKLYKNRHPDSEVKPSVVLFVLSIIVLLTWVSLFQPDSSNYTGRAILTIGLAGITLIIIYMVYNLFITDLVYYYYKDFRKHKSIIRVLRQMFFPKHNKSRIFQSITILIPFFLVFILLWIPNFITSIPIAIVIFIGIHFFVNLFYYWLQKFLRKEFLYRPAVFFLAFFLLLLSLVFAILAFYFWRNTAIAWEESPAVARTFNHECIFLDYFDYHDLWHVMSAFTIFTIYLSTFLIDDNLYFVQRDKIDVF